MRGVIPNYYFIFILHPLLFVVILILLYFITIHPLILTISILIIGNYQALTMCNTFSDYGKLNECLLSIELESMNDTIQRNK